MNNEQLWQAVLGELELAISKANFTTWFRNTYVTSCQAGEVIVAVPNTFTKAWLENKYHETIVKALTNITKNSVRTVTYRVETTGASPKNSFSLPETPRKPDPNERAPGETTHGLNPKYTFGAFVVGKGNELAKAASLAVVEKLGIVYN